MDESMRMFRNETTSCITNVLMQVPWSQGSHIFVIGRHWSNTAKVQARVQARVTPPHMRLPIFMSLTGKILL